MDTGPASSNATYKVEGVVYATENKIPSVQDSNPGPTACRPHALTTLLTYGLEMSDHMSNQSLFRCTTRNGANMELHVTPPPCCTLLKTEILSVCCDKIDRGKRTGVRNRKPKNHPSGN